MIAYKELRQMAVNRYPQIRKLTMVHLLSVWGAEDPSNELASLLNGSGIKPAEFESVLMTFAENPVPADLEILHLSLSCRRGSDSMGYELISTMCQNPDHRITRALIQSGMDRGLVLENIEKLIPAETSHSKMAVQIDEKTGELLKYGRDLTQMAGQGSFKDLYFREREIGKITNVLDRKMKGNVVLTGPPGVGKTALVESLAVKALEDPDSKLAGKHFFEISMGKVVAGTMYRGQFEERFESIIGNIQKHDEMILFIDEMHLLWGAGRAEGVITDAGNLIKPYLARGDIRVIGATTSEEYHEYILRDDALARRFQEIKISEPDEAMIYEMVKRQTESLKTHHGMDISENMIREAVDLTNRHLPGRYQPDKALDLLDSACVAVKPRKSIDGDDLLNTLSELTDLPIGTLTGDNKNNLINLEKALKARVIGQEEAIETIAPKIIHRRISAKMRPSKSMGVFIFLGDPGVGKTELAIQLARHVFGSSDKLVRIDMGEYSDIVTAAHFLNPGGELMKALQKNAFGVLLLDEIEKACPDLYKKLMALIERGEITDSRGRKFDLRQWIIVFTSNAVTSKDLEKKPFGFVQASESRTSAARLLENTFPGEFIDRMDALIPFRRLSEENLRQILSLRLNELNGMYEAEGLHLHYDEDMMIDYLLDFTDRESGSARELNRVIEIRLNEPLAMKRLTAGENDVKTIVLDEGFYKTGKITCVK